MADIIFKEESYKIIGACMTVHSILGPGFLEAVYHEALEKEFRKQNIPFISHKKLTVFYDGEPLKKYYVADFLCYDSIVVEIKATSGLIKTHYDQTSNYLKAIRMRLGLLVDFGTPSLTYKRILNSDHSHKLE